MEYNKIRTMINPYGVPREFFDKNFDGYKNKFEGKGLDLVTVLRKFEIDYRDGKLTGDKKDDSRRDNKSFKTKGKSSSGDSGGSDNS